MRKERESSVRKIEKSESLLKANARESALMCMVIVATMCVKRHHSRLLSSHLVLAIVIDFDFDF